MIYATGYVTILESPNSKIRKKYSRKYLTLTYMEDENIKTALRIKYSFAVFLPKDYSCRFLEDYTGKLKPFIEKHLSKRVVSIQVTHLNYVSEQAARNITRK